MRNKLFITITLLGIITTLKAQEKWTLLRCVQYATDNNITVRQNALQSKTAELLLKQSKLDRFPSLSFSGGPGYSSGRSQDPTTFSLSTQSYLSANMQLQSSAEIFNWFSKKNTIAANEWELQAARASNDKLKNDIALAVANSFLQILLAKEQEKIAKIQLQQSQAQLSNTRKLVDAGSLPELNAAELEAQVARDSATAITARGTVYQNILNLKANMSMDADSYFEIEAPSVDNIPIEKIADLQPDAVYQLALTNMPQQQYNSFKIKAAEKNSEAAKGRLYPTISAFGSLGSRYNNRSEEITGSTLINPAIGKVNVNGVDYNVYSPFPYPNYSYGKQPFLSQLNQNFNQSVGLSLSIPIFNGYNARTNYETSKLTIKNLQLQRELDAKTLKSDIYRAYDAAVVALEKFNAGKKSLETAERTYNFAKKRYEVGMMNTFELITNQNNLFSAKLQDALNQFDYIFKMKVLEYYKGQGLKF